MSPLPTDQLPIGNEWIYQLKWDGVRLITSVHQGQIELFSRQGNIKNGTFPELIDHFAKLKHPSFVVDGEVVVIDEGLQRPSFQKVLQRERSARHAQTMVARYPVVYVLFDLLAYEGQSLLHEPFQTRDSLLRELFPHPSPQLIVTDSFDEPASLWNWVEERHWEGVVAKRLNSTYHSGKRHQDWYKKKRALLLQVLIIGVHVKHGRVASLVMSYEQELENGLSYIGKVSGGLNERRRQLLKQYAQEHQATRMPFAKLPLELQANEIIWLSKPLKASVQGLEFTTGGLLRHPQIIQIELAGDEKR